MTAPVRCWLVYRGHRVDPNGFMTTVDPADPASSDEHLRRELAKAIRAEGLNPSAVKHHYCLDVQRTDLIAAAVTTVRLT